mmetsp:Transcript_75006/g.219726  ORF Transcript_75006/g.219726 Transcript_75006/m.219726 type:complete len:220 (+) Transcript_75006:36-695(+)
MWRALAWAPSAGAALASGAVRMRSARSRSTSRSPPNFIKPRQDKEVGKQNVPPSGPQKEGDDPFGLRSRFCLEQRLCFDEAMEEIRSGRKRGHWSWFLFPTAPYVVEGEERGSMMNREYCLRDPPPNDLRGDDAARAFLRFSAEGVDLRANYVAMMTAVAEQLESGRTAEELVGFMDEPKLRSSLELFERVARGGFDEEVCALCLRALAALGPPAQRPW